MSDNTKQDAPLSFRAKEEVKHMLPILEKLEEASRSVIINHAIEEYYQKRVGSAGQFLQGLNDDGLIGCINAGASFSKTYKDELKSKMKKKYDNS